jgi:hypothetical protein
MTTYDYKSNEYKTRKPYGSKIATNLTQDIGKTSKVASISQTVNFSAGAAGTTGVVGLEYNNIRNSAGGNIGSYITATDNDSSFSWTTGTVLTTETEWDISKTDTEQLALMSNGDYAVNYLTGEIRYKKATTGTSDTASYKVRLDKVDTELELHGDVYIDNVKTYATDISDPTSQSYGLVDSEGYLVSNLGKVSGTATSVNSGNVSDGTQRITIADDDTNLSAINTAVTSLETKDFATETTLSNIDTNVTTLSTVDYATETTLTSIDTNVGDILTSVEATETLLTDVVDTSANLVRVAEQDPLPFHFSNEVIADSTNTVDGTYYYYVDMDTFSEHGTQLYIDSGSGSVTVTIEATLQDDGTAPESCTYVDVSSLWGSASWTASDILVDGDKISGQFKYIRYKVIADTTSADDSSHKITIKKKW